MPKSGGDFMAAHASLVAARAAKNDEFYTQWNDIENEMQAYLEYDSDVFRGKTGWEYLDGDGDFRSDEVTALRNEADMVITNPPFSLFREFMAWLVECAVKFSVIGNSNAITYKEVFPLIKENRLWLGATGNTTDMVFRVPQGAVVKESDKTKAARLGYPSTEATTYTRLGNSCWFTNIEHGRRHEPLVLMTMEYNLVYGSKKVRSAGYPKYDNYDAIEVPETKGIPSDYAGVMGVPISFFDKCSPEQFEILGCSDNGLIDDLYKLPHFKKHNEPYVDGKKVYKRIFIKHKTQNELEGKGLYGLTGNLANQTESIPERVIFSKV